MKYKLFFSQYIQHLVTPHILAGGLFFGSSSYVNKSITFW